MKRGQMSPLELVVLAAVLLVVAFIIIAIFNRFTGRGVDSVDKVFDKFGDCDKDDVQNLFDKCCMTHDGISDVDIFGCPHDIKEKDDRKKTCEEKKAECAAAEKKST